MLLEADCGNRADFGGFLLLGGEPPFMPDARPSLEASGSLFHIYFSEPNTESFFTAAAGGSRPQKPPLFVGEARNVCLGSTLFRGARRQREAIGRARTEKMKTAPCR